jgi:predicted nucleotidyltransferase
MCDQAQLAQITTAMVREARRVFGDKLDKVILYGSYARGDFDAKFDIDIMILAHIDQADICRFRKPFTHLASDLGLEHDILVSVCINDSPTFNKWVDDLPFYRHVRDAGVLLSA